MSSRSRVVVILAAVALCLVVVLDSAIHAQVRQFPQQQGNQRQQGQMRNLPQLDLQGTVDYVAVPGLKLTSDAKQTWMLRVTTETKVEIKGKASQDKLVPGTYIAFTAEVNKKGARVDEKVKEVTIFTPSNRMQVGAVPEGAGLSGMSGLNVGGSDQPFGAAAPAAGGKGAGRSKGAAKNAAKAAAGKTTETFEVKGQISSIKSGKVTLKVPNDYFKASLRFELAEDAEVSVDIEGTLASCGPLPSLIKPGDRVEVKGVQMAENAGNVSELKVTLGGAAGEEPAAKGEGKGRAKADAKEGKGKDKEKADSEDTPAKGKKGTTKKKAEKKDEEEK